MDLRSGAGPAAAGQDAIAQLASAQYTENLPNAPAGKYVVIQYQTAFEKMSSATETIVPMLDKDGHWRVSGYYVKANDEK